MFALRAVGKYRDTLRYRGNTGEEKVEHRPWRYNQIQDSALHLLVANTINASGNSSNIFVGYGAITYLAVGGGLVGWDADPNNVTKPVTQTALTTEMARFPLTPDEFVFLDSSGVVLSPQVLSNRFKVSYTLGVNDANGDLREFGLFGGLATPVADSGTMFNWITHPLINKDNTLVIEREIDIEFSINRS